MHFHELAKSGYVSFVRTGNCAFTLLDARLDAIRQYVSVDDVELILETEELSSQVYDWKNSFDALASSMKSAIEAYIREETEFVRAANDLTHHIEMRKLEQTRDELLSDGRLERVREMESGYRTDPLFMKFYSASKDGSLGGIGKSVYALVGMKSKASAFEALIDAGNAIAQERAEAESAVRWKAKQPVHLPDMARMNRAKSVVIDCWKEAVRLLGSSGSVVWEVDRQLAILLARVCSKMATEKGADTIAVPFGDEQDTLSSGVISQMKEFQAKTREVLEHSIKV